MENLATEFSAALSGLLIANVATILSVIFIGMKALWWTSKLSFRVDENEKDINEAHKKLRSVEKRVNDI